MRRLRRALWNLVTAISLAVALAAVVLWVRSERWLDQYGWMNARTRDLTFVTSFRGTLQVSRMDDAPRQYGAKAVVWEVGGFAQRIDRAPWPGGLPSAEWVHLATPRGARVDEALGFRLMTGSAAWAPRIRSARVPDWTVLLASLPIPAARAAQWHRRRRARRKGLCPACGYDLRATPARCPECGRVPGSVAR